MQHLILPAIMSGGAGTRLWPASTEAHPKQFHAFAGGGPLIAETAARVRGETETLRFLPPLVICNAQHAALTRQRLAEAGLALGALATEPVGRNTAATAVIAAALAAERDPAPLVLLLPADHLIEDRDAFLAAIARAAPFAADRIVTFGVKPTRPATGYGYIERGAALAPGVFEIASFREKPDIATAQAYLDRGGYSWNSGMFLFHPRVLLEEFDAAPAIRVGALAALAKARRAGDEIALDAESFAATPALPLDIAVMEKTARAVVAPCDIGWADIGSWDEIWRLSPQDDAGNVLHGPALALDARNNLLRSDGVKICVAGVEDLVVIATAEAVVIVPRDRAQDVKALRELAQKLSD